MMKRSERVKNTKNGEATAKLDIGSALPLPLSSDSSSLTLNSMLSTSSPT